MNIVNNSPEGSGNEQSGWTYQNSVLTIYSGFEVDLTGETLDCKVTNNGTILGGTYNGTVTNDGGTINGAEFYGAVTNQNVGTLSYCTFHTAVTNGTTTDTDDATKSTIENSQFQEETTQPKDAIINNGIFINNDSFSYVHSRIANNRTGIIKSGNYGSYISNSGIIENGVYINNPTNQSNGIIKGGVFTGTTQKNETGATIEGGIFLKLTKANNAGTITGGIFANNLEISGQRKVTVQDCTLNDLITNTAYVVSDQKLVVTTKAWKFKEWSATGIALTECDSDNDDRTVTLTIDLSIVQADDEISVKRISEKVDLALDSDNLPAERDDEGNRYTGSAYDGWKYVENTDTSTGTISRTLTLYNNYPINFAGHEISWRINNNGNDLSGGVLGGIIEDGTFTGPITNANTIKTGQFSGTVSNTGTIEDGIYLNTVSNYGIVKDGTYAGRFVNGTRTTQDADGNDVYTDGYVESGVFSRYADFGNQADVMPIDGEDGFSVQWIKLGGATVNDVITEQVGIVGKQTIKVTVDNTSTFDHWSIGGDADLSSIRKQLDGHLKDTTLYLDLDGADGGMILLTAETSALPGKLSVNDFKFKAPENLTADGTAKNATITAEKSGVGEISLHYYDAEGNRLASAPTKAGTYTVGISVAATDDYEAASLTSEEWSFTIAEKTYQITVVNGESNMTTAAAGAKVTVTAKDAPAGQKFSKWTSDTADTLFVEKTDTKTSFIMPEGDVTITAVYEKLPEEKPSDKPEEKPEEKPDPKPSEEPDDKPEEKPEVKVYSVHVFDGETEVNGALASESKAGESVTVRLLPEAVPAGQEFDHWEVLPETLELKDASATETTFVMPEEAVTLRAVYHEIVAAPQKANPASVALGAAVIGTGVVLTGWAAYNIGTELYAKWVLPAGAQMPATRGELAVLLWQNAGSPEVATAEGETLTDLEKAERWVVDNGLMTEKKDSGFGTEDKVSKLEVFMTLKKAQAIGK